jgi:hypothetical protein
MVGRGYYDPETGQDTPIDANQGGIIYTGAASVKVWSSFPGLETADSDVLGVTRHGDVQMSWKSEQSFIEFLNRFNVRVQKSIKEESGAVVL